MATNQPRRWVLESYPDGLPVPENFRLEEAPPPEADAGQVVVRAIYLSVDPYMRGRMSPVGNYAPGLQLGDPVVGEGVGEVIESKAAGFSAGDIVRGPFCWQEVAVFDGSAAEKLDPSAAPIQSALSYLGMPGRTAYFGLLHVLQAKTGETVVVSAASGAVGQVVGQIAKIHGCRVVAVASSAEKLAWCKEIGYDEGINYREAGDDLPAVMKDVCPDGVDVYFDNTAGPIHDAVVQNLALRGRIAVCGVVSLNAKFGKPDIGPRYVRQLLIKRARVEGFLVSDFQEHFPEAMEKLASWVHEGKLKFREDIVEGIEHMPSAFIKLMHSENFGKQLVRLGEDPAG